MKARILALALLLVGALLTGSPANAQPTPKWVVTKEDTWSSVKSYAAPDVVGVGTHIETWRTVVTNDYLYWPDGKRVNKIAPYMTQVCYYKVSGTGALLQMIEARPYFFDDNDDVYQAWIPVLHKTGQNKKCRSVAIPNEDRVWFRMDQSPGWEIEGHMALKFSKDKHWDFTWGDSTTKYFHPDHDPDLGNYYLEWNANWRGAGH